MACPALMIFTAVTLEAKAVAGALGMDCPGPGRAVVRELGRHSMSLHLIGIGGRGLGDVPVPAAGVSCVMMAGLAGALDPSLCIGDIVMSPMEHAPSASAPAADVLSSVNVRVRQGGIWTSDRIVATPQEKAELFARTGALAVDMENSTAREWAKRHGAAFGAIRAISDRADQSLDPAVVRLVDAWGRARPITVLRTLIGRPLMVPRLMRLGADSKVAARQLGIAVKEFVREYEAARATN